VIPHSPLDEQKHFQAFHFFPCDFGFPDECADCDAIFPSERQLDDHKINQGPSLVLSILNQLICYDAFLSNDDLLEHIEVGR